MFTLATRTSFEICSFSSILLYYQLIDCYQTSNKPFKNKISIHIILQHALFHLMYSQNLHQCHSDWNTYTSWCMCFNRCGIPFLFITVFLYTNFCFFINYCGTFTNVIFRQFCRYYPSQIFEKRHQNFSGTFLWRYITKSCIIFSNLFGSVFYYCILSIIDCPHILEF